MLWMISSDFTVNFTSKLSLHLESILYQVFHVCKILLLKKKKQKPQKLVFTKFSFSRDITDDWEEWYGSWKRYRHHPCQLPTQKENSVRQIFAPAGIWHSPHSLHLPEGRQRTFVFFKQMIEVTSEARVEVNLINCPQMMSTLTRRPHLELDTDEGHTWLQFDPDANFEDQTNHLRFADLENLDPSQQLYWKTAFHHQLGWASYLAMDV